MKEHELMNNIRVELSKHGFISFRTNVGKIRMSDGRWFDTGLPKGFSDIFAISPNGQAVFIECKVRPNKPTKEQEAFITVMRRQGCNAGVAYSIEEALDICRVQKRK